MVRVVEIIHEREALSSFDEVSSSFKLLPATVSVGVLSDDVPHPVCRASHMFPVFQILCQTGGRKKKVD